ncbi:MAG: SEC-C metal-binding domain-containing protein [Sandaracinaceae bacterium]
MAKLGRNDPCHCGSGDKYKKCHLKADAAARTAELAAEQATAKAAAEAARAAEEEEGSDASKKDASKESFAKGTKKRGGKPAHAAPTARQIRRRGIA